MGRAKPRHSDACPYVGRGGLKLRFALDHFSIDVRAAIAIDLGSHIGGFVDCLLQAAASRVYAVDVAYGTLAWKLRQDKRVVVCERTNALHWTPPERADIVTIDVGWTRQSLILRAAAKMIGEGGTVLSLLKPQYEAPKHLIRRGVLPPECLDQVLAEARGGIPPGLEFLGEVQSPYPGSGGNAEYWWHLRRSAGIKP